MAPACGYKSSQEILRDLRLERGHTTADPSFLAGAFQLSHPLWQDARLRYTIAGWQSSSDRPVPEQLRLEAYGQTQGTQLPVREKPREVLQKNSQKTLEKKLPEELQQKLDEPVTRLDTVKKPREVLQKTSSQMLMEKLLEAIQKKLDEPVTGQNTVETPPETREESLDHLTSH